MEIKKNDLKIKCDIMGCKNLVNYSVSTSDNPRNNLNICESCLKELHKQFSKVVTPKSIKNIYQKGGLNEKNK
ncbi:MAG: hypothetical protein IKB42_04550 [Clostridia bacterium]|jgi:hypothetical protein|nr:hypothetical protein [Clostridia bacterium]